METGPAPHPEKTWIPGAAVVEFVFLGCRFKQGKKYPGPKAEKKLKDSVRRMTKHSNGDSLPGIIRGLNRTLAGWMEYFKHAHKSP